MICRNKLRGQSGLEIQDSGLGSLGGRPRRALQETMTSVLGVLRHHDCLVVNIVNRKAQDFILDQSPLHPGNDCWSVFGRSRRAIPDARAIEACAFGCSRFCLHFPPSLTLLERTSVACSPKQSSALQAIGISIARTGVFGIGWSWSTGRSLRQTPCSTACHGPFWAMARTRWREPARLAALGTSRTLDMPWRRARTPDDQATCRWRDHGGTTSTPHVPCRRRRCGSSAHTAKPWARMPHSR